MDLAKPPVGPLGPVSSAFVGFGSPPAAQPSSVSPPGFAGLGGLGCASGFARALGTGGALSTAGFEGVAARGGNGGGSDLARSRTSDIAFSRSSDSVRAREPGAGGGTDFSRIRARVGVVDSTSVTTSSASCPAIIEGSISIAGVGISLTVTPLRAASITAAAVSADISIVSSSISANGALASATLTWTVSSSIASGVLAPVAAAIGAEESRGMV